MCVINPPRRKHLPSNTDIPGVPHLEVALNDVHEPNLIRPRRGRALTAQTDRGKDKRAADTRRRQTRRRARVEASVGQRQARQQTRTKRARHETRASSPTARANAHVEQRQDRPAGRQGEGQARRAKAKPSGRQGQGRGRRRKQGRRQAKARPTGSQGQDCLRMAATIASVPPSARSAQPSTPTQPTTKPLSTHPGPTPAPQPPHPGPRPTDRRANYLTPAASIPRNSFLRSAISSRSRAANSNCRSRAAFIIWSVNCCTRSASSDRAMDPTFSLT
jgi:hypothetical protein